MRHCCVRSCVRISSLHFPSSPVSSLCLTNRIVLERHFTLKSHGPVNDGSWTGNRQGSQNIIYGASHKVFEEVVRGKKLKKWKHCSEKASHLCFEKLLSRHSKICNSKTESPNLGFSDLTAPRNHLGILLTCTF